MNKLLSILFVSAVAAVSIPAQAASHAGGAPMKASEPAKAASDAKKKADKKADKKAEKKEEAKK